MNGKRAAFLSLGCKVNSYETQAMEEMLVKRGFISVPFEDTADIYVINTCTVTAISDKKSRQMIRRAKRKNPDALVVACGCFAQKDVDAKELGCDIILGNNNKTKLLEAITKRLSYIDDMGSRNISYEDMSLIKPSGHTRGFIKVQDGCDRYCAYCIIPKVRGKSRSRNPEEIIKEAKSFAKSGCLEIVLCAVNLSDYSYDGVLLGQLIRRLNDVDGIKRIRLGSLEPDVFDEEFVRALTLSDKVCPHFHFSLQSACDKTLSEMRRRYTFGSCKKAVDLLRKAYDNPAICADVIAGFPGESDKDFSECYENIKELGLYELHVFPYSEREGTAAAKRTDIIGMDIRRERAGQLIELSLKMKEEYLSAFKDKTLSVLFEEEVFWEGKRYLSGFSGEYIKVLCESSEDITNKILPCTFNGKRYVDIPGVSLLL